MGGLAGRLGVRMNGLGVLLDRGRPEERLDLLETLPRVDRGDRVSFGRLWVNVGLFPMGLVGTHGAVD